MREERANNLKFWKTWGVDREAGLGESTQKGLGQSEDSVRALDTEG